MYKIFCNGLRFNNKTFNNYEDARRYVRNWLRKHFSDLVASYPSGNAAISDFGFRVKRG